MAKTTFLPDALFSSTEVSGSGSLSASEINERANEPRDLTTTVAARGAPLPMLYGERDVPGLVFAIGTYPSTTDLVIGFIWCLGECQSIEAVYLNNATFPTGAGNVVATHYLGTPSQGVDPTLASSVAAYADTMRVPVPGGGHIGICYSVFRIPAGKITGFPRARAHIKGRKVYDPRTLTTAYSDNPALCVADLISNPVFGLGRTVNGVAECADWDDSLLGGVAGAYRARLALYIASGRPADEYVDLMCEYAECFRVNEGDEIRLIPDAPVDLEDASVFVIGTDQVLKDSLQLQAESSADTPTEMEVQYTVKPSDPTQPWGMEPVTVSLAGVEEGEVPHIPTSVTLEGVTRSVEASNKALARLMRMQNRITATWVALDKAVVHQRGDVVRVQSEKRGVLDLPIRIMDVNMIAPGRYQVSGKRYDASHYPADLVLPEDEGIVPVGLIGMLVGTTVPDGWALFNDANDKYIVGAGGTYAVGASGTSTAGPWSGTVTGGSHTPADDMPVARAGAGPISSRITPNNNPLGSHSHNWSVTSVTENILRRENVLVIKTGSPGLRIPSSVRVFGLDNTLTEATKNIGFVNRLLMAKSASANAGVSVGAAATASMTSGDNYHVHLQVTTTPLATFGGVGTPARANMEAGGTHTHTLSLIPTWNVKRKQLCCFEGVVDYAVRPGLIFLWSGSIGSLPTDFVLCNGSSGTPDMRDRFVEFAADTSAASAGNNTMTLSGTSWPVGHSHDGGAIAYPGDAGGQGHGYTDSHSHTVSASVTYVPKYYALAFIMYRPAS